MRVSVTLTGGVGLVSLASNGGDAGTPSGSVSAGMKRAQADARPENASSTVEAARKETGCIVRPWTGAGKDRKEFNMSHRRLLSAFNVLVSWSSRLVCGASTLVRPAFYLNL